MSITPSAARFPMGQLVVTHEAARELSPDDVLKALVRHIDGDWGNVPPEDWEQNDEAVDSGSRLFSSYKTQTGTTFWIVTEPDRSATTILLPLNY